MWYFAYIDRIPNSPPCTVELEMTENSLATEKS